MFGRSRLPEQDNFPKNIKSLCISINVLLCQFLPCGKSWKRFVNSKTIRPYKRLLYSFSVINKASLSPIPSSSKWVWSSTPVQ